MFDLVLQRGESAVRHSAVDIRSRARAVLYLYMIGRTQGQFEDVAALQLTRTKLNLPIEKHAGII